MKRLLLSLILLAWTALAQADGTFLPPQRLAALQGVTEVYIGDIGAMLRTPRMVPPLERHPRRSAFHKPLNEADRQALLALLAKSPALATAPAVENCRYQPGFRLDFVDAAGKVATTLLICFNCDVWAVAGSDAKIGLDWNPAPAPLAFGSAKAERQQLLELIRPYFDTRLPKQ